MKGSEQRICMRCGNNLPDSLSEDLYHQRHLAARVAHRCRTKRGIRNHADLVVVLYSLASSCIPTRRLKGLCSII